MASRFRPYKTTAQVAEEVTTYGTAETSAQYNWVGYIQGTPGEDTSRNKESVRVIGNRNIQKQVDGKLESKVTIEVRENVANLLHYAFGRTHVQPTFLGTIEDTNPGDTTAFTAYTAKSTSLVLAGVTNFMQYDIVKVDDPTVDLLYYTRITTLGAAEAASTISPVIPTDMTVTTTTIQEVDGSDTVSATVAGALTVVVYAGFGAKFTNGDNVMWYDGEHTEVRAVTVATDTLTFGALTWAHPANTILIVLDSATHSELTVITAIEPIGENDIALTSETGFVAGDHAYILGITANEYPVLRLAESVSSNKCIVSKGIPYATTTSDLFAAHYAAGPYQHDIYFAEADELPSCTIEVTKEASTNLQSRFDGCVCNSAELTIEEGGILMGAYEFITQFPVGGTGSVTTSASAAADKTRKPWTWDEMVVEYSTDDGAAWTGFTSAKSITIGINNGAEGEYFLGTSKDISEVTPGTREYTFTIKILPAVAATFYLEGAKSTTAQAEYAWRVTWNRLGSEYDSLQVVLKGGFVDPHAVEGAADSKIMSDLTWNFQSDDNINNEIGHARIITKNPNLYIDEGLVS